ncbi:MAG: DUF1850 domain-containing protein [Tenuifilaceae bacterium]|jgi:hypothetical protein|nr:DUF1850 domain-containing protein [Pseudomonas sp.]MDY0254978.1 DUF1850 domain-containing protein [Tenuifilaceae bacterium]NLO53886.1 DUF1850 domain-containing protein [Gammaproteobacteria bacterium]
MLSKQHNKLLFFALSAIVALSALVLTRPIRFIQFASTDLQCALTLQTFELQWIHSVEKERWQETYQIADQQLLLTTTQFKTFGAGTPSNTGVIASTDGWLHYKIKRLLPRIHWVVSRNVESTVLTEFGEWPLYHDLGDYAEIQIQVMQVPRWHYFIQESCNDYFKKP